MSAPNSDPRVSYGRMLVHLREPHLLATRAARIIASNIAGAEALGTSVGALAGASLLDHSPDPVRVEEALVSVPLGETSRAFPLRARDGRRFSCDASALDDDVLLLRLSGGPEPEPRARVFDETLRRLDDLVPKVSDARVREIVEGLLEKAMTARGVIAAGVFLLDKSGANLELVGSANYPEEYVDRFRLIPMSAPIPLTDAVKKGTPIVLCAAEEYATQYPEFTKVHPTVAQRAMACIPIRAEKHTIGVVGLGFPLPWTLEAPDRKVLDGLVEECAEAFGRAPRATSARAEADRAAKQLGRLHAFTGALAQAITMAHVIETVVDMGMESASASAGGLWILDPKTATLSLVRSVGPSGPMIERFESLPLAQPMRMPILDAVADGRPVWMESFRQFEEHYPEMCHAFSKGKESALACLPLFAQGRCIGGLTLRFEGAHRFSESERAFLQLLSWYSAQAIERARLLGTEKAAREAAEASQRRSRFLADASAILSSSLDYAATLKSVAGAAVPAVAEWCVVALKNPKQGTISDVAAHADPTKAELVLELSRRHRASGYLDHGINGVMRTGTAELYRSLSADQVRAALPDDPDIADLYVGLGLVSSMVVPITARGRTLGAIVLNAVQAPGYDEADLAMAEELGMRAGIAVDNARLYDEAREADRRKDEFLAMLGHELRNPLAPILTALELMDLTGDEAFMRERSIIFRQVQHVVRLVDDLLDLARITSGKIQLRTERVPLSRAISEAVAMVSPLLERRSHELTTSSPPIDPTLVADEARLAQAIANLLTNAAKYTEPNGTISLDASVDGTEIVIRVRDSGVGIAPEMLPHVFDAFVQEKRSLDRAQGGLGIGLTVVRRIVELHGGSVSASSEGLGLGSEFVIRLPCAPEDGGRTGADLVSPERSDPPRSRVWRVLIVDDNADAAMMLSAALEALGCSTVVASDAPTALLEAPSFAPDLVLLDIGLPGMDGYELARGLRALPETAKARLVAITGYGQDTDRSRAKNAGVDEHFVKPVDLDKLRGILDRLGS